MKFGKYLLDNQVSEWSRQVSIYSLVLIYFSLVKNQNIKKNVYIKVVFILLCCK